ncbi:MAG: ketoacyl-ACP synthase III [Planctomycetes bacterium]|nr:ketoacyl-ACP synthase III [Planctomycetota bacterium]
MSLRSKILGTGRFVPENVVTNEDLAKRFNTTDEWIQQRTGVKERRYILPGQGPAELAEKASRAALEAAGLAPSDLDFILVATQTPEHQFPGTSCYLQARLGIKGCPALDVACQCTGFLHGLAIADAYVRTGAYKRILVVGAEVHSTGLQFTDAGRHVTVLFGDGAGAVVVGAGDDPERGILSIELHADGSFADDLTVPAPGSVFQPRIDADMLAKGMHYPRMNGKVVFKEAVTSLIATIKSTLATNHLTIADVDFFIPHQANMRINEAVAKEFGFGEGKVDHSIQRYGNCAAASVPIAFDEHVRAGRIKPGSTVLFATFAAGFTWGSALLRM